MKTKFSGKHPVMFYQDGDGNLNKYTGPRVRIFYPDGKAEWGSLGQDYYNDEIFAFEFDRNNDPCWLPSDKSKWPKNMKESIELAKKWDDKRGFSKMEFLGEL